MTSTGTVRGFFCRGFFVDKSLFTSATSISDSHQCFPLSSVSSLVSSSFFSPLTSRSLPFPPAYSSPLKDLPHPLVRYSSELSAQLPCRFVSPSSFLVSVSSRLCPHPVGCTSSLPRHNAAVQNRIPLSTSKAAGFLKKKSKRDQYSSLISNYKIQTWISSDVTTSNNRHFCLENVPR